jgi:L-asparaginase/beta-aspartyl-peptidase (threonine type)
MTFTPFIAVHGGVGAPRVFSDGCEAATARGMALLTDGQDALAAAIAAAEVLEDDGRFNAGSGSSLRIDGVTLETDAAVMDSTGKLGSVAALQGFKNPVRVAEAVTTTPHLMLVGEGAREFALKRGFAPHPGPGPLAHERYAEVMKAMREHDYSDIPAFWRTYDLKADWNFERPYDDVFAMCDTIGAVSMDAEGRFAAAVSTGGSAPMLKGRVGDSPLPGCGYYAGPEGAVVATGIGEAIIMKMLSKTVYDWIAAGAHPQEACERGIALFPDEIPVGLIAVSREGTGTHNNREMPTHQLSLAAR